MTKLISNFCSILFLDSLAEVVPCLNAFISLIGALCSTGLALIVPVVIEMVCAWGTSSGTSWPMLTKNAVIMIIGVIGLVTGTYESLHNLAKAFRGIN